MKTEVVRKLVDNNGQDNICLIKLDGTMVYPDVYSSIVFNDTDELLELTAKKNNSDGKTVTEYHDYVTIFAIMFNN